MTRTEIFEAMCEGYLNERYRIWKCMGERNEDWLFYTGALGVLESFGCDWRRNESNGHIVNFLSTEDAKRLNIHAYD